MNKKFLLIFIVAALFTLTFSDIYAQKLPADKAGTIGELSGQIGFIREGSIWVMNADGSNPALITDVKNADGRLSWAPGNKKIIFTRSGLVDLRGPDNLGGKHKVYDLFVAFLDSAYANNRQYWYRLTEDLGNRGPEWQPDGNIVFWKDMNANKVNAGEPNYQICTMDSNGDYVKLLRKDWQNMTETFMISPSLSKDGNLAFVYFEKQRPIGLVVTPIDSAMNSLDKFKEIAQANKAKVGPAWSPDGKWLAYISNDMNKPGLYMTTPDLKETYLVTIPPVGTYMNAFAPSFSPDSKWITFSTTDGSIWVVDITGNGLRRVTPPGSNKAPAWSK